VAVDEARDEAAIGDPGESGMVRTGLKPGNPLGSVPYGPDVKAMGIVSTAAEADSGVCGVEILDRAGCVHGSISSKKMSEKYRFK
jgi:hypothetical protein